MKYKIKKKYKYYKNLKYKVNENIKNRIEFYIADDIQKLIYKKCFKYLGILSVEDLIDMFDIPKEIDISRYDEIVKNYIDDRLKGFMKKLENVVEYNSLNKQILSQNARCRIGWFDKGEYRYLGYLQEKKEKLGKIMKL